MQIFNKVFSASLFSVFVFAQISLAQTSPITLGSPATDIKTKYGQPLKDFVTVLKFQTCEGAEGEAKWVFVFLPPFPDASEAEKATGGKLTGIQRHACASEKINEAVLKDETKVFIPSDAKFVREFKTEDGRKAWEYTSEVVSAKFSKSDFMGCDAEGRVIAAAPGTFTYSLSNDGLSWFLGLGNCL